MLWPHLEAAKASGKSVSSWTLVGPLALLDTKISMGICSYGGDSVHRKGFSTQCVYGVAAAKLRRRLSRELAASSDGLIGWHALPLPSHSPASAAALSFFVAGGSVDDSSGRPASDFLLPLEALLAVVALLCIP